jgi:plasmid rolling circle replication initiator protein Rep
MMGAVFNTLAQNGTTGYENGVAESATIITGQGSQLGNEKVLKGRAKRKMITQAMTLNLISVAEKKENADRLKTFWNTYHCQNRLVTHEGRLYGRYCKNRLCTLCCCIRKAEIINKYYPVIRTWEHPYFLTLTVKSCFAKGLKVFMRGFIKAFKRIVEKYRKRNQRGKGIKLVGVKSLECNFNFKERTYNPHFHLILADKRIAETLIEEWLRIWGKKYTYHVAQKLRAVADLEHDLIEVIKYGSKIFTEPDVTKKTKDIGDRKIYIKALYNITEAMQGLRIFDRFGFDLPKNVKERVGARVVNNAQEWVFVPEYCDWLNTENELVLTGYVPSVEVRLLLENRVDTESD